MKTQSSGRRRIHPGWAAAALLLGVGLVGCGAGVPHASATHPAAPAKTATAPPPAQVEAVASAFSVRDLSGSTVSVPNGAPTVVYFMSATCGSCIQGEQQLAQLATQLPGSVRLLSLDVTPQYDTA